MLHVSWVKFKPDNQQHSEREKEATSQKSFDLGTYEVIFHPEIVVKRSNVYFQNKHEGSDSNKKRKTGKGENMLLIGVQKTFESKKLMKVQGFRKFSSIKRVYETKIIKPQ